MKLSTLITKIIDTLYLPVIGRFIPLQTFRYGLCGGANMMLDLIYYYVIFHFVLCKQNLDLGIVVLSAHIAALFIVFPITFFNGFWLNKNIAFRHSPLKGSTQLLRYMLSVAGAIVLNYLCMKLFVDLLKIYPTPSKALTTVISIGYSYVMQKYFSFRGGV